MSDASPILRCLKYRSANCSPACSASWLPGRRSWMRMKISSASSLASTMRSPHNLRRMPCAYCTAMSYSLAEAVVKDGLDGNRRTTYSYSYNASYSSFSATSASPLSTIASASRGERGFRSIHLWTRLRVRSGRPWARNRRADARRPSGVFGLGADSSSQVSESSNWYDCWPAAGTLVARAISRGPRR